MAFDDQYGRAVVSGNLKQTEAWRVSDPDRLMALAFTDRRLGSHLYRARIVNDAQKYRELRDMWRAELREIARKRRWTVMLHAQLTPAYMELCEVIVPPSYCFAIADASLRAWIFDVCPACLGRRFELLEGLDLEGRQVLSDRACKECEGTGKAKLRITDVDPVPARVIEKLVEESVRLLSGRYESVTRRASKRMGR